MGAEFQNERTGFDYSSEIWSDSFGKQTVVRLDQYDASQSIPADERDEPMLLGTDVPFQWRRIR